MQNRIILCGVFVFIISCTGSLTASSIVLTFNFDSSDPDVLGDPSTDTNGVYNIQDDYDNVPSNTPFLAFDASFQPLITLDVTGSGTTLETFGGTGLGIDNAELDMTETIDITFTEPVYIIGIASDALTGTDTMVYSANNGVNGGFESAIFGDDGVVSTYFLLNANDPLRIASVNGSFAMSSLTVHLPEPSTRGMAAGLLTLAILRKRKRDATNLYSRRKQQIKYHWYRLTGCYLRLGL